MTRINLVVTQSAKPNCFNVDAGRQRIVTEAADPHHDACKALVAMGCKSGSAVFLRYVSGQYRPVETMSIQWGARHSAFDRLPKRYRTNRGGGTS